MKRYKSIFKEERQYIFIRKISDSEQKSESKKKSAMKSFPEKEGWEIVYRAYGEDGRGFYYMKGE